MCAWAGCLPAGIDSKALLSENWVAKAGEAAAPAESSTPPPAFNPKDPQYNELVRRLSKSAAMRKVQALEQTVAASEKQLQGLTGDAKEAKKAELEEAQQQLTEAQAELSELQASFEQEPLSLTPWMSALFALADSGCSTFDTGGAVSASHPAPGVPLLDLLAPPVAAAGGPAGVSAWLYRGAEKVLGTFKRRYELERGPGKLCVTTRLALSPFGGSSTAELASAAEVGLEASRQTVLGPEAAAAGGVLDTVLLHWLDYESMGSFVAVLLALKRYLAPPGYDAAAAAAAGEALEVQPKLAALGLVNPPAAAITAAVRAGVPVSSVSVPFSLLDTSATPLLALCAQHGVKVFASAPTAHGLISEAFLGTAAPDPAAGALPGCDNLAAGLDMVARYGGWARFQELLRALKDVADKHATSVQVVALSWLQRQGVVPVLPAHWGPGQEGVAAALPWSLTLGLQQHHTLDTPPHVAAAVTPAAAPADTPAAAVGEDGGVGQDAAAAEGEGEAAGAGATAEEGVVAEGGDGVAAAAAAAVAQGVDGEGAAAGGGAEGAKVAASKGVWVEGLRELLGQGDLDALAAYVGRPAWPAAA